MCPGDWTEGELNTLRELGGTMLAREIADRVGRTWMATQTKLRQLGIRGFRGLPRGWTPEQVAALRAKPKEMTAREFAALHGLDTRAVMQWAKKFGVSRGPIRTFTAEEAARIRELASTMTAREIAAELGKPLHSVRDKALAMGVHFTSGKRGPRPEKYRARPERQYVKPPWTPEQDELLRASAGRCQAAELVRRGGVELRRMDVQSVSRIEWCGDCGAPVSNWDEHYERMGHRRPWTAARVA